MPELKKMSERHPTHPGYFLVVAKGNSWYWSYYYEGKRVVRCDESMGSEGECLEEIEVMRTCAEAEIYLDG